MDPHTRELVALAASVAGRCQPCFAYHFEQAQHLGIAQAQIDEAIQLAKDIRASGTKHMDGYVQRRIKENKEP